MVHFDAIAAADCIELYSQFEAARTILNRSKCFHIYWHHTDSSLCSGWIAVVIRTSNVWRNYRIPIVLRYVIVA